MAKSKVKGKKPAGYDSFKKEIEYNSTQIQHGEKEQGFENGPVVAIHPKFAQMCEYIRALREEGKPLPEHLFTTTKAVTHTRGNER